MNMVEKINPYEIKSALEPRNNLKLNNLEQPTEISLKQKKTSLAFKKIFYHIIKARNEQLKNNPDFSVKKNENLKKEVKTDSKDSDLKKRILQKMMQASEQGAKQEKSVMQQKKEEQKKQKIITNLKKELVQIEKLRKEILNANIDEKTLTKIDVKIIRLKRLIKEKEQALTNQKE